jgi:hypothetical protein
MATTTTASAANGIATTSTTTNAANANAANSIAANINSPNLNAANADATPGATTTKRGKLPKVLASSANAFDRLRDAHNKQ